ncbi:hypothetical protein HPG69_008460 [Diceros bicornis minor]|uniref:Interleukin-15 receptor subunit alpha n=1 Tax=Diceros bicornis minor TaxID=77932 RepID=A0A7J7FKS2_DICBM|nr:hypothetical protein HPG69_008460 [Diceros bicornis minor]
MQGLLSGGEDGQDQDGGSGPSSRKLGFLGRSRPVHKEQCSLENASEQTVHLSPLICTFAGITCPTPTSVEHADIRVKSYNLSSKERYVCNSGFKRKAGTSSLTECVLNTTTNLAHWTTPNLKCIRDPSLTHERPPSTLAPSGVTSEPQSPTPSGKEPAFTSKSDTTVATKPAIIPGSRLMPSKPPSAGTTGVVSHEPSQAPSQTTALEHTPSVALQETPGAYQYNSRVVTVAVSIPVTLLFGVCVVLLLVYYKVLRPLAPLSKPVHYLLCRRTSRRANVEMENMEDIPMAGGTSGREEDTENYPHDLGSSGLLLAWETSTRMTPAFQLLKTLLQLGALHALKGSKEIRCPVNPLDLRIQKEEH